MDYLAERRLRLTEILKSEGLDALLISNPVNVTYLTGFSGDSSWLIFQAHRTLLVSDGRFSQQIAEECPDLETHIRPPGQKLQEAVAQVLAKLGPRAVGLESGHVSVADWEMLRELAPAIDWKAGPERVECLRIRKDPSEVAQIREAVAVAERAFTVFRTRLRPGAREKQLSDNLELHIRRAGGQSSSFASIVAIAARSALPHARPTDKALSNGDFVLIDWGASGPLYKSDLTRILCTRTISPKLEQVYMVVLKAQERALRTIRPGVKASDVDAEARSVIAQAGFGQFFGHGLGHGLGLEVHEAPALRQNSDTVLAEGMVVTVEPGIYLPDWGGVRIEDDILVTPDGCEVLTTLPKDLASILVSAEC